MTERAPVTLEARPHPLRPDIYTCEVQYGLSIADMLPNAHAHTFVFVGDALIPRAYWRQVRPKPGAIVTVKAMAAGGDDSNKVLRTVAMIAVAALAIYTGNVIGLNTFWGAAAAAGISIGGQMLINALIPPQLPEAPLSAGAGSFNRKLSITGTRNNANPYGAIPCIFGRHQLFPPWQAAPFTEVLGENQFLRGLVCLGYGPMSVYNIRIGDTDIDAFDDVEYEISAAPALFSGSVTEIALALSWGQPDTNDSYTQTTALETDEISLDITFQAGLFAVSDEGNTGTAKNTYAIEYRLTGTSDPWLNAILAGGFHTSALWGEKGTVPGDERLVVTGRARETRRIGCRWKVPRGQYDVRVTFKSWQTFVGSQSNQWFVDSTWTALRSFTHETPIQNLPDCQFLAFRIRATDQLQGMIDRLNVEVSRHVQVWDDVSDTWSYQESSNPAWQYLDPLIGVAAKGTQTQRNALRDNRVDKAAIKAWADDCTAKGWTFDGVIDAATTRFQMMRDIAAVGRAAFDNYNGQYTIVRDVLQTVPVQLFTPRNSWGFSGNRPAIKLPHAVRVWYTDPSSGWQQREKIVYRTGYDDTNATDFMELEARGVTDQTQAWRYGLYYLAELELRAETYTLNVDIENLVARRGDLVHVGSEIIKAGLGFGRIKSLVVDGNGDATEITLDETLTMEAGHSYKVRIRRADGTQALQAVTTAAGDTPTLTLSAPVADVAVGDLVAMMETGQELLALKIKEILPGPDLTAQLKLKDAAPSIHDVDTEVPPAADDPLSLVIDPAMLKCCVPVIDAGGARSDSNAANQASGGIKIPTIKLPVKHQEAVV